MLTMIDKGPQNVPRMTFRRLAQGRIVFFSRVFIYLGKSVQLLNLNEFHKYVNSPIY